MRRAAPRASVVIPTCGRRQSVERALRALTRQTFPPSESEVVISIDGSEDGTREMVEQFEATFEVRPLWQPNRGRASACNSGVRAARGDVVVLLDDDMEPAPGFLEAHVRAHPDGSKRGVLGAVPIVVERDAAPVVEYMAARFTGHMEKLSRPDHVIGIRDVYTGNFSARRQTLLDSGLFDEGFRIYGNEDVELAIRLLASGVQLVFIPEALAHQHYEKSFAALARDKIAQGRTSVVCALKHPESVPCLRIGTYRAGERKWRLLRGSLIALSRGLRFLPDAVVRLIEWFERRRSPRLQSLYYLSLDYFYWLGVGSGLRDYPEASRLPVR